MMPSKLGKLKYVHSKKTFFIDDYLKTRSNVLIEQNRTQVMKL